jgi:uncharacterized NAD(P)/FAD-binding protein YdhS
MAYAPAPMSFGAHWQMSNRPDFSAMCGVGGKSSVTVCRHPSQTGQLTIVPGGVRSAQNTTSEVNVTLVDRQLRVGAVINCTGPCVDVRRTRDPLIRCLLESGVARPGPLNLGLETGVGGCLPGTNDALWVVGPLRKGRQWETTAIPDIRTQAAELPHSIRQTDVFVGV